MSQYLHQREPWQTDNYGKGFVTYSVTQKHPPTQYYKMLIIIVHHFSEEGQIYEINAQIIYSIIIYITL